MGRAAGPKPVAVIAEVRLENGLEHLQHGLLDQPVQHRRHPQRALPAPGFGDHHPAHRLRLVGARVKRRPHARPMLLQPWPQLTGRHAVDASGTGVALDASERQGEVLAGEDLVPQARLGGVSGGVIRRRAAAALWAGVFGLHPPTLPARPPKGLAAVTATATSTNVLALGFAFGPSRRSTIPPVLRPLLTSPRRAAASRPPPSRPTRRTAPTRWTGIPRHPRRSPGISPATFTAHPPHLRDGPLMTSGFAIACWLARAAPPPMRFVSLGSRIRLRLPSHPASRRRSCPRLVVGAINPHRGLTPPSGWTCPAYTTKAALGRPSRCTTDERSATCGRPAPSS